MSTSNKSDWVSLEVVKLLDLFLAAAVVTGRPYAIGGALAMGVHGYRRHTNDVDAYVTFEDRGEWIRALRTQGLMVTPLFSGVHYVATLPEQSNPEIRIDLLVPADDPDLSAIHMSSSAMIADRRVEVWPIDPLVIAKFRSTRDEDRADVDKMFERGLFDPKSVRLFISRMSEPELAQDFWKKYGDDR